jgi:hypothetical protein
VPDGVPVTGAVLHGVVVVPAAEAVSGGIRALIATAELRISGTARRMRLDLGILTGLGK